MPAPAGTKRMRGTQIWRPFVYGSIAKLLPDDDKEKEKQGIPREHTHSWTVFVKGVNDEDVSYWLKKVQFKLHETYANAVRLVDGPPFEVTETGWGEFEVQVKLYFVPESNEKPQALWHSLKLHPYGPDAEGIKERREPVSSQNYDEVLFNEPVEQFYNLLTTGDFLNGVMRGKIGKGAKAQQALSGRTAEIPFQDSPGNPYSKKAESDEVDRLGESAKTVERLVGEERGKLAEREKRLAELRKMTEGMAVKKK